MLQAFIMYTSTDYNIHCAFPLLFYLSLLILLAPLSNPFYLLGTLLAVTGSVHLGLRLLVNWPPLSKPSPLQIPRTQDTQRLTKTTSRWIRRLLSGTSLVDIHCQKRLTDSLAVSIKIWKIWECCEPTFFTDRNIPMIITDCSRFPNLQGNAALIFNVVSHIVQDMTTGQGAMSSEVVKEGCHQKSGGVPPPPLMSAGLFFKRR